MPKKIASADLVGIYGDPDRAKAEAEADLEKLHAWQRQDWLSMAYTGVWSASLTQTMHTKERNADFKLKRAKAAIKIRDVQTSPVLFGWSPAQLKIGIVAGLIAAGFLFFS